MPCGRTSRSLLRAATLLTTATAVLVAAPLAYAADPETVPALVVSVHPENAALRVEWSGGSADGYTVQATPRTAGLAAPDAVAAEPGTSGAFVTGLANGETYDVTVSAPDPAVFGAAAGTPRTVPGAPVVGAVTAGSGSAVVRWTAPASDGGAPISSYAVTALPSGVLVTTPADARATTVTGLANGVATRFVVTAVNVAGPSAESAPSAVVTPRQLAKLTVAVPPARQVVYGTATVVNATMSGAGGVRIPGQRVDLLAQIRPTTTWQRVASGTTDGAGNVSLRATLPASSALKLRHPASAVAAPDLAVQSVLVATRLNAVPSATRIKHGQTLAVRGNVAPAHPAGSPVVLQRYVSGAWRTVANGRMITTSAYGVSWRPGPGVYLLRVVKPADADHVAGTSPQWRQQVDAETTAEVAAAILRNARITLATVHVGGVSDAAYARQNVLDVAAGKPARRSSYQNAPGGYTTLDIRVLRTIRQIGAVTSVTVSEIAGGSHARGSAHYSGRAVDITWVGGRHVARGSGYSVVLDVCRAHGASRIFHPSYDPYGGHQRHVHCEWA